MSMRSGWEESANAKVLRVSLLQSAHILGMYWWQTNSNNWRSRNRCH